MVKAVNLTSGYERPDLEMTRGLFLDLDIQTNSLIGYRLVLQLGPLTSGHMVSTASISRIGKVPIKGAEDVFLFG